MAYATKYYDYQIAVVFAILLGGLLLLALVVAAIYYICVVNMRGKKGGITRVPSGRSTLVRTRMGEWQPQSQQYPSPQELQQQQYGYGTESYPAQPQPQYTYQQAQYEQQQPSASSAAGVAVRELQPEYFQQQGPITYTTSYPYEPRQPQQQSYQQPQSTGPPPTTYHMSAV